MNRCLLLLIFVTAVWGLLGCEKPKVIYPILASSPQIGSVTWWPLEEPQVGLHYEVGARFSDDSITGSGPINTTNAMSSTARVEAVLTANPAGSATVNLPDGGVDRSPDGKQVSWDWLVKPNKPGPFSISLTITRSIKSAHGPAEKVSLTSIQRVVAKPDASTGVSG